MRSARAALRSAERALRAARGRYVTATMAEILVARKALDAAIARRDQAADLYASLVSRLPFPGRTVRPAAGILI